MEPIIKQTIFPISIKICKLLWILKSIQWRANNSVSENNTIYQTIFHEWKKSVEVLTQCICYYELQSLYHLNKLIIRNKSNNPTYGPSNNKTFRIFWNEMRTFNTTAF